jgi:hypothetical protein
MKVTMKEATRRWPNWRNALYSTLDEATAEHHTEEGGDEGDDAAATEPNTRPVLDAVGS